MAHTNTGRTCIIMQYTHRPETVLLSCRLVSAGCKDLNLGCNENAAVNECCSGLECKNLGLLGTSCQKAGCKAPTEACNVDADCCLNIRCRSFGPVKFCSV
jgi:hypothetical protein